MKRLVNRLLFPVLFLAVISVAPAFAEEGDTALDIPGTVEGTGTVFEVTDSDYLNVSLCSSEVINLELQSIPQTVTMLIESAEGAAATNLVFGGFVPNTTYYKYEDSYENLVAFTTDDTGAYTYRQDLSAPHLVFIQPVASTLFLRDDATGGDATSIGTWDPATKTCTLTTDVYETIQIVASGITLDGNGHTITGLGTGAGVYMSGDYVAGDARDVTVRNLNIVGFTYGVYLTRFSYVTVADNTITNCAYGVYIGRRNDYTTISGNATSGNTYSGIMAYSMSSSPHIITGNTSVGDGSYGIYVARTDYCELTLNSVSLTGFGIRVNDSHYITIADNTVADNQVAGIMLNRCYYSTVSHNIAADNAQYGLYLNASRTDEVCSNAISGSGTGGVYMVSSSSNTLHNNEITGSTGYGLSLGASRGNTIHSNLIGENAGSGLTMSNSIENLVYGNNFLANGTCQAKVSPPYTGENLFCLPLPDGGNFWSDWTSPDTDGDGIVDLPYVFSGGQDDLPLADAVPLPPLFGNTPVGTDVTLDLDSGIIVTFPEVTVAGDTTATTSETPPHGPPTGFRFLGQYFDISTTAEYIGPVTITIPFDPADVPGGKVDRLKLFHWVDVNGGEWQQVPIGLDPVNNVVIAQVDHLCWFALATPLYQFHGFLAPVNESRTQPFKRGSTLPIKFRISDEVGDPVTDAVCTLTIYYLVSGAPSGEAEVVSTAAGDWGDEFRYDAEDDLYIFNLSTKDPSFVGYYTYQAEAVLDDGSTHSVDFSLK